MKKKNNNNKFQSKEIKRNKELNDDYKMAVSFLVVLLIIGALVGLLFIFNAKFVTKDHFQEEQTTTTTTIKYDDSVISVTDLFKQKNKEYMVMCYDFNDDKQSVLYDSISGSYDGKMALYKIDLSKAMNKKYYDENGKENTNPKNASDVLITRPTLIIIKDGKVSSYITKSDEIVKKLS